LIHAADRPEEILGAHPLNRSSEMHYVSLSDAVGLQRIGVHVIRLRPGKESCVYHSHTTEEEWIYILSGHGLAEIDGDEHEVGAGDFMGFPTPSVGHHLKNPFTEDLVYLVGGERREIEIGEFPRLGKRVLRIGREAYLVDSAVLEPFGKPQE
jgi:uncharacterized cupin superfamily protein